LVLSVSVATPGPTVLLALSNDSQYGLRGAAYSIAGSASADVVLVALVRFGLGAVLSASEAAFLILRYLGAAWLA